MWMPMSSLSSHDAHKLLHQEEYEDAWVHCWVTHLFSIQTALSTLYPSTKWTTCEGLSFSSNNPFLCTLYFSQGNGWKKGKRCVHVKRFYIVRHGWRHDKTEMDEGSFPFSSDQYDRNPPASTPPPTLISCACPPSPWEWPCAACEWPWPSPEGGRLRYSHSDRQSTSDLIGIPAGVAWGIRWRKASPRRPPDPNARSTWDVHSWEVVSMMSCRNYGNALEKPQNRWCKKEALNMLDNNVRHKNHLFWQTVSCP